MRNLSAEINYSKWQLSIYQDLQIKYKDFLETCDDTIESSVLDSLNVINEYISSLENQIAYLEQEVDLHKPLPQYWQDQIDDILKYYDFEKVKAVLSYLKSEGYDKSDSAVPTVEELQYDANELMRSVVKEFERLNSDNKYYSIRGNLNGFISEILPVKNSEKFYITLHYQAI